MISRSKKGGTKMDSIEPAVIRGSSFWNLGRRSLRVAVGSLDRSLKRLLSLFRPDHLAERISDGSGKATLLQEVALLCMEPAGRIGLPRGEEGLEFALRQRLDFLNRLYPVPGYL
jgi:hypothetical protein